MNDPRALRLWYTRPAEKWVEALPLGNGRLGAMIFGGVPHERIALNEDTLWSGAPRDPNNPHARELLPPARAALARGDYTLADDLCRRMQGPYNESYQPAGDLLLHFFHANESIVDYVRDLDLRTGVASITYAVGGVVYRRECFASAPDQAIVLHVECDRAGALNFAVALAAPLPELAQIDYDAGQGRLDAVAHLASHAPFHVAPDYHDVPEPVVVRDPASGAAGMTFAVGVALRTDGTTVATPGGIEVRGATSATLLIAAATSFAGWQQSALVAQGDPSAMVAATLDALYGMPYTAMRARHVADHGSLFGRVEIDLGASAAAALPTNERIATFTSGNDPALLALIFQYGRYLLIASSRPGGQPANLQGIWNQHVRPVWSSNWTININTQMNYWLAEPANLAECHMPLLELIGGLAEAGATTARVMYDCPGWCSHHNADLWRQTSPPGDYGNGNPTWSMWPMSGAWLCRHLWAHYLYGGDTQWLRSVAWPILREAARFCLAWLVEDATVGGARGRLVTAPSTSPENNFHLADGYAGAVSIGSTMDFAIVRDLFGNCLAAAALLGEDEALCSEMRAALERLPPYQVGRLGQLQEWLEEWDRADDHHRHLSHLYGVHPGNSITATAAPDLMAAARRSLELRGDDGTGWSKACKIHWWARLGEGDRALRLVESLIALEEREEVAFLGGGLYANLFAAHPPFQIDGNFGATSGMIEMLLQCHDGAIHLLPALPAAWRSGSVAGLRCPGGFEVTINWLDGALVSATIWAARGEEFRFRCSRFRGTLRLVDEFGLPVAISNGPLGDSLFDAAAGGRYLLTVEPLRAG